MYTDIQHELGKFVKLKSDESVHDVIKRDGLRKYKKTDPTFVKEIEDDQITVMSKEGPVTGVKGDYIAKNPLRESEKGNRWIIKKDSFNNLFEKNSINISDPENEGFKAYTKKAEVEAVQINCEFDVKVLWQDQPIHGKAGDWLIINPNKQPDLGICDHDIFLQTYKSDILERKQKLKLMQAQKIQTQKTQIIKPLSLTIKK